MGSQVAIEKKRKSSAKRSSEQSEPKKKLPIFARRLRAARELRGLSQGDLAARAVLQQPAVSFYERGSRRPSYGNLRKLADALEVTADYLIGRSPNPGTVPNTDDEVLLAYERLTLSDRRIARELILQLAKRNS
ncbi:MAG: transcriptional regulator with XRE-family HTH domain [Hyphomicrobiaceae bacterium]